MESVWWLSFWTAVGLCAGSFLNVVIYRLPRSRSLREPLWSACPHCNKRIRWYDNIPIVSYLWLGGRCRHCKAGIATRYLIIEVSMAITVLLLLDAFFIGQSREGLSRSVVGLTDRLAGDWPILLAHIVLFACLLSMSVVDLEHYWVDIRFTNLATLAGFALHAIWTPRHSLDWSRPQEMTGLTCLVVVAGLGVTILALICQPNVDAEDFGEDEVPEHGPPPDATKPTSAPSRKTMGLALLAALPLVAMLAFLLLDLTGTSITGHAIRALPVLVLLLLLIIGDSTRTRDSDHEIVEAIETERHGARGMVATELLLLLPSVLLAVACAWYAASGSNIDVRIGDALAGRSAFWTGELGRGWNPFLGIATAASGYVIAGGIGWLVRIVFTLVLGKEAFGTGDIHLMAAAGCVAGWPVVLLGFFVAVVLALIGWIVVLPVKRSRAIPLGPWLSLAFLIVVVFYDKMIQWPFLEQIIKANRLLFS